MSEGQRNAGCAALVPKRARLVRGNLDVVFDDRREQRHGLEQQTASGQPAVAACPHDQVDARRLAGEGLVDVVFTVPNQHHVRGQFQNAGSRVGAFEPALRLLVLQSALLPVADLFHAARPDPRAGKAQNRFFVRVDGHNSMAKEAEAPAVARTAQAAAATVGT